MKVSPACNNVFDDKRVLIEDFTTQLAAQLTFRAKMYGHLCFDRGVVRVNKSSHSAVFVNLYSTAFHSHGC